MDVYQISYPDQDGTRIRWAGSRAAARSIAREAVSEGTIATIDSVIIKSMQLPTDRAGMIIWLDTHFQQWLIQ